MRKHGTLTDVRACRRIGILDFAKPEDRIRLHNRLVEQTEVSDTGCWLWTGAKSNGGYGKITMQGKNKGVHAISFEAFVKKPSAGMIVRHKCDVPNCWNPDHLEEGTHKDNIQDSISRGRFKSIMLFHPCERVRRRVLL